MELGFVTFYDICPENEPGISMMFTACTGVFIFLNKCMLKKLNAL